MALHSSTKYLTQRGDRFFLHWSIPKDLRHLFGGRSAVTRTLHTCDRSTAILRRDLAIAELMKVVRTARDTNEDQQFHSFLDEIRQLNGESPAPYVPTPAPAPIPKHEHEHPEPVSKPVPLFKDTVRQYIKEHEGSLSVGAVSRLKMAPTLFLQHVDLKDIHLSDIDKRDVQAWVVESCKVRATATIKAYAGALSGLWEWAYRSRKVEGENPFRELNLRLPPSKIKRGAFTPEQVGQLLDNATTGMRTLMEFALITGCRLGELTTLTVLNFHEKDGVSFFQITDGKTENAARTIPLPVTLWQRLKDVVESGLWVREKTPTRDASAYWSATFNKMKGSVLGDADGLVFHSFRKMTATAYQQAGVFEGTTAELLGHSRKGLTMSYGLYSTGYELQQLLDAVEVMIASEYMQSYLVLFT